MYDILVVGGGPAGLTAAIYAARAGFSVLVLEKLAQGGQVATAPVVDNYPGFPAVFGMDLAEKLTEHARSAGVEFAAGDAQKFELSGPVKTVHAGEKSYEAKAVILAQGTHRRKLNVPGEDEFLGRGVSYCATCDGNFFRNKAVAVVGGGNTALGDAAELAGICKSVSLILRHEEPKAMKSDVERARKQENIEFVTNSEVARIEGGQKVERLVLRNRGDGTERTIPVDGVFVAVGVLPNSEALADVLPLSDGYIETDESCATTIPGVFVAGDLRKKRLLQIVTAVSDGANAAWSAQEYLYGRQ